MKSGYSAQQKADLVVGIICLWTMSWWRGAEVEGSEVRSGQRLELFDGCKWTTAQGGVIDLSSLGNKDNTPRFPDVPADKYLYSYNPCYPFQEGTCSAAAVCQMTATKDEYYQAGDATGAELTEYQGKPSIHYKADTDIERNSYVTLICDQSATTPALKALGDISYADYHFELTTVCACPDGCGGGSGPDGPAQRPMDLSIGSIFCITVLAVLLVYVVVGVAYNRARHHKRGAELLPHLSFWTSFPAVVKDGCLFTTSKLRRGKYQSI